ncbi:hypothetical protein Acsp04_28550 [Actinomadura sp. NBRC 104425]|nr:hypothetical protein [Actinomadura sp. NBRC 104425]GLZ12620.1 hypothetical protein Acsp04_28550 [Actinomadura sp. NBRC 104425]
MQRSPKAGAVGTVLLDVSSADLLRRVTRIDTAAAAASVPCAAWCLSPPR